MWVTLFQQLYFMALSIAICPERIEDGLVKSWNDQNADEPAKQIQVRAHTK